LASTPAEFAPAQPRLAPSAKTQSSRRELRWIIGGDFAVQSLSLAL
jgi:hypothetical protein